jgi:hypothetical protein
MNTYTFKIKISCNWSSSEEVTKRLITQFKTTDKDIEGFEFVHGDDYDLHVVFGYINDKIIDGKPTFVFPQEPTWTGGHQKGFSGINNIKVFGFSKHHYHPISVVIETVAHMFYGGRGPWEEGFDFWNYDNLISSDFNKTKDFCSFISNRGKDDLTHPLGCTYGERVSLVNNIHKDVPFVDFYGWGNNDNFKPFAHRKGDAIKDYKFCLTVENSHEKYYISEKFYDCILTNTIPIYYGCSNIKDYWTENGYFLLDNITDHQYVTDKLKWIYENQDELYNQMLPEVLKMKKRYFEEFNLLKKIRKEYYEL